VRLEEVAPAARAPILQRYLQLAPGARAHVPVDPGAPLAEFERIASQYPVFRVRTGKRREEDARASGVRLAATGDSTADVPFDEELR
jgi:hypothetical protein